MELRLRVQPAVLLEQRKRQVEPRGVLEREPPALHQECRHHRVDLREEALVFVRETVQEEAPEATQRLLGETLKDPPVLYVSYSFPTRTLSSKDTYGRPSSLLASPVTSDPSKPLSAPYRGGSVCYLKHPRVPVR